MVAISLQDMCQATCRLIDSVRKLGWRLLST